MQGNCSEADAAGALRLDAASAAELLPLKPRQCVLLTHEPLLTITSGKVWLDNVYLQLRRTAVRPRMAFVAAGVAGSEEFEMQQIAHSDLYATNVTFHGESRGSAHAYYADATNTRAFFGGALPRHRSAPHRPLVHRSPVRCHARQGSLLWRRVSGCQAIRWFFECVLCSRRSTGQPGKPRRPQHVFRAFRRINFDPSAACVRACVSERQLWSCVGRALWCSVVWRRMQCAHHKTASSACSAVNRIVMVAIPDRGRLALPQMCQTGLMCVVGEACCMRCARAQHTLHVQELVCKSWFSYFEHI